MPTSCRFIQYIQISTEAVIASAQTYQNRGGSVVSISIDRHLQYTHYGDLTTMLAAFYYTRTAYTHCDMTHLILRLPTIYRPPPGELPRSKRLSHEKQKKKKNHRKFRPWEHLNANYRIYLQYFVYMCVAFGST